VPEGGGPDESWLPAGEGGVGEGGDPGAGASPRAEQPWPKKPAGHGERIGCSSLRGEGVN